MKKIYLVVLLLCASIFSLDAQRTITGTVSDAEGFGLPGVNVMIKGTTMGSITDFDGKYTVDVPEEYSTLVYSFVGYKTQEMDLSASNSMDLVLEEDLVGLEEVVVTAIGISREKKALGYSVAEIDNDEILKSGENNVVSSLASKAAGVQVISSGGTPGASSKVLLRGNSTFTGENQPLFVVDGVPISNSTSSTVAGDYPFNENLSGVNYSNRGIDINPDDIESVTVLKGPVAAALYGVRAGNGAIVITTKKGSRGSGVKVSYSTSLDISQINKMPELQDTYAQGGGGGIIDADGNVIAEGTFDEGDKGPDGVWGTGAYNPFAGGDDVSYGTSESWGPTISSLGRTATDNVDEFFQDGIAYSNNVAISGGNQSSSFRLSLGQLNQKGVIPNSEFNRYSVRLTGDSDISSTLRATGTVNYINSGGTKVQNGSNLSGVMLGLTRTPASFDLLGGNGPNGYDLTSGDQHQYFVVYDNPHWTAHENPQTDEVNRVLGNFSLNYTPADWVNVTYRVGADVYSDARKQIFSIYSWDPPNPTGQIEENTQRYREFYADLLIGLNRDFSDKVKGSITLGNNLNDRRFQDTYARGRDLSIEGFYNLGNASNLYADEANTIVRTAALFFDANLEYNRTLYLNVAGRNEWSSTFGKDNKSFFVPSASLSLVFTELLPENNILSFGKIRYGYSQAGISPPVYSSSTFFTQPTITDGFTDGVSFPFLGQNGFGYSPTIGDPNLEPEIVTGNEVGVDLRFLNGRLNLDATYYIQKSSNLLMNAPIPASSGYQFIYSNLGEMENRGIELELSATPVKMSGFEWNINANFSRNVNEVLKLADGVDEINIEAAFGSIGSFAIVGDPYGALYGTEAYKSGSDELIIGTNGLPLVKPERGNVGNPFPDWLAGIRNSFSYKGLSLTGLIDIRKGGDIWCGTCARLNRLGRTEISADRDRTYVIPGVKQAVDEFGELEFDEEGNPVASTIANDVEVSPYVYYQSFLGDASGSTTEQAVYDGSWVRLRELGLSYDFGKILNKGGFVKGLNVYFTGRNLWLNTDYPGVDPETSLTGAGSNVSGFDYFNNPSTKSFIFGLRADF